MSFSPRVMLSIEVQTESGGNFSDDPPETWEKLRQEWFELTPLGGHEYEIALVTRFGVEATATVSHKSMEDTSHYADSSKHDEDRQMIEEITYFIEYKYNYNQPYKATFCISNKALYNRIEIGSEVPIKLLPSAPDKSVPRRACLANTYGFEISDCQ